MTAAPPLALDVDDASVWVPSGKKLLDRVTWQVAPGQTWAVLGPNGAGKSTLLSLASTARHPSAGRVSILGQALGEVDIWTLKAHIGVVDQALRMPPDLLVEELVLTGRSGSVQPMWSLYGQADYDRVPQLLELFGCGHLRGRTCRNLSQGERGRVRIARAMMADPRILLLDEPGTGLDLMAREELLKALTALRDHAPQTAVVIVSHHVEELPQSTSHALLLRDGGVVSCGTVGTALSSASLSDCFGGRIELISASGRWAARM